MLDAAFLIPLLPLAGFVVLLATGRRLGDPLAGVVATIAVAGAFAAAVVTWVGLLARPAATRSYTEHLWTWLAVGGLRIPVAILVDPLSITMALFVTGIAALIHLYSIGYMRGDAQYPKFFVYLNLFVFSMLVLVLSNNLVMTFVGWEGVGVCSYWLVSFWFGRPSAATAGKKAFVYNRIGDVGFMLGTFLLFEKTGSVTYHGIFAAISAGRLSTETATAAALLLFLAAVGKSAQIPLFPWLVDAMEGPTPVSALIHAATMVTAGVYLMCRISPILDLSHDASTVVASIGAVTAFVAAAAACAQHDIKKVLAFSTVSQLGYMFLAVGSHAYVAAVFLMVAHAFYKALLFLGAGSTIHGMHEEQDLRRMGGLRKLLPITSATFIVAWFSIAGLPPFSGFFAKGDVLLNAFQDNRLLWALGVLTAVLTAYYIGRETMLAFFGTPRWKDPQLAGAGGAHEVAPPPAQASSAGGVPSPAGEHSGAAPGRTSPSVVPVPGLSVGDVEGHGAFHGEPHESPPVMWVPLVVLAVLAAFGGLLDLAGTRLDELDRFLAPLFGRGLHDLVMSGSQRDLLESADALAAVIGIVAAIALWRSVWQRPALEPGVLRAGWGLDALNDRVFARTGTAVAGFLATVVEWKVIDGAVNGVVAAVRGTGGAVRHLQTGYVRNYALGLVLGTVLILAFVLSRVGL